MKEDADGRGILHVKWREMLAAFWQVKLEDGHNLEDPVLRGIC